MMETFFLLFAAAFGASALGGVLGMASGIFIVPMLTLFFHIDIRGAIAASLVSVIACSCGSAAPFLKRGLTNIRIAIVLETATTLGALTGALLAGLLPTAFLYGLFAAILAVSAMQMLARRREEALTEAPPSGTWTTALRLHSSYPEHSEGGAAVPYYVDRLPLGLGLMLGAGVISALLGIGSGVLKIPAMDTALRLPLKVSSATSNFMIGVTAAASAGVYLMRGEIAMMVAGPVALGSVVGSLAGARLLFGLPAGKLRLFFVVVLVLLAFQMLMTALGFNWLGQTA